MLKISCFITMLVFSFSLFTQNPPDVLWTNTYGGIEDDYASSILQTSEGDFILACKTYSFGEDTANYWLVKIDDSGNQLWDSVYNYNYSDNICKALQTSDGGYIMVGIINSGVYNIWLVKTDEIGTELWSQEIGGIAASANLTNDGGLIISGFMDDYNSEPNALIIKTDTMGNVEWSRIYGGAEMDIAHDAIQTSDGGYIVVGSIESYGAEGKDFWVIKTDEDGYNEWNYNFGGPEDEVANSVVQASDGGFVIAGYTNSYGAGGDDFWVIKVDENGDEVWNQTYGGIHPEQASSISSTSDGGFIISGYTFSYGAGNKDYWLVKIDSDGNEEWDQTYGGSTRDYAVSAIQLSDGGFVLAGSTESFGAGETDIYVVRLDQQTQSDDEYIITNPLQFLCYPNPFNPETHFSFQLQEKSFIELSIYDLRGQKIKTLTNTTLDSGTHSINWDGKNSFGFTVSSGMYFYKLNINNDNQLTGKCILIK